MDTDNDDTPDGSTTDRWTAYKAQQREAGREPMTWGEWLRAGEPVDAER